ncbi:hypothetical protein [Maritimibacter sp. UBA3975]|uniref:hypothetical protein n=1 Tax=Maritimibacter sp. UBA3975 TaxID=1946833 RepID=UPI0025BA2611|nr:hypothetical protein [Maritimibacter sp. UBA3975]
MALATGHVMQRTVSQPNVVFDMPSQQAAVTQAAVSPPTAPVEVAEAAPEPLPVPQNVPEIEDVTKADIAPATDPIASIPEPVAPEPPAPNMVAEVAEPAVADPILDQAPQADVAPLPVKTADDEASFADLLPDEPRVAEPEDFRVAEVTRAAADDGLPMPDLGEPIFDVSPADVTPTPMAPQTTDACDPALDASAMVGAMIYIDLKASCDAGAEVEFNHAGLRFTETLDEAGKLSVMLPAMQSDAKVEVVIEGHATPIAANVTITDMADFDRVALVWQGGTGLQLHAMENGATYGEAGHIWAEEPGFPTRASDGDGGFITVLGSTMGGYAADVYTYPVSMPAAPAVSIEAQVLETTCGGPILGEYLRSVSDGAPKVTQVGMIVPACDAVGEYLVLKNLPQDLTIARN